MTVLEKWLTDMVKIVVGDAPKAFEPDKNRASYQADWKDVEQRAAIMLVQARALECRYLAGEALVKMPSEYTGDDPVKEALFSGMRAMATIISKSCWDRSHKLETVGLMLAKPDGWPIKDGNETMICRCKIDLGEAKDEAGKFVCATCKLPKHGSAGNQVVAVVQ